MVNKDNVIEVAINKWQLIVQGITLIVAISKMLSIVKLCTVNDI